jgi:hypothetical protein
LFQPGGSGGSAHESGQIRLGEVEASAAGTAAAKAAASPVRMLAARLMVRAGCMAISGD